MPIPKTAIEYLKSERAKQTVPYQKFYDEAIAALEKQLHKKPLRACGHATNRTMNFCPMCGQALDWSDEG